MWLENVLSAFTVTKPCKRTLNKKSELKLGIKLQSPARNIKYILIVPLGQSINQAILPLADNLITMQLWALLHIMPKSKSTRRTQRILNLSFFFSRENVGKFETVLQHQKNQTAVNNSNSNRIQESNHVRFFKNENFNLLYIFSNFSFLACF